MTMSDRTEVSWSPCGNILYPIVCFTKCWTLLLPYLCATESYEDAPFHTQSQYCHLLLLNLFTCGMFRTGVSGVFNHFPSLLLPLSQPVWNLIQSKQIFKRYVKKDLQLITICFIYILLSVFTFMAVRVVVLVHLRPTIQHLWQI